MTTERRSSSQRIWSRDPTLWTGTDEARWLGWLDEPLRMREDLGALLGARRFGRSELDAVVLLGMGGSSLAPEVLRRCVRRRDLPRARHDPPCGDPRAQEALDLERTLFFGLVEVGLHARDALTPRVLLEARAARSQWLAITDPGSELERLA